MKKTNLFFYIVGIIILSACSSSSISRPTTIPSVAQIPPTATIAPTSSPTPIPVSPVISASNVMNLQEDFRIGQGGVSDAAWMPDGNVALAYSTGISIYDPTSGNLIKSIEPENKAEGFSILSPNGKQVATLIYKDDKALIWDANTGKVVYDWDIKCAAQFAGNAGGTFNQLIAFNSDGSQLAVCDGEGVSVWDISSGEKINTFKIERKDFLSIAFNSKENILATIGSANGFTDIVIWDLASGEAIKRLPQSSAWTAGNIRFNHKGNILAWRDSSGGFAGPKITLYDINTNQMQIIYPGNFQIFEFSLDDKTLTFGSVYGWGTRLLDIATGKFITGTNNNVANLIKYSPDGSRFVAGWDDFSVFRNVGGPELKRLRSFITYNQIAFDPGGKYIAVGGEFVALWDLQTKERKFDQIFASGNSFLFTPRGDGLITNALSRNNYWLGIQQWDLNAGNQQKFEKAIADSFAVNKPPLFSPSGDLLAIGFPFDQPVPTFIFGGGETYIRFWDANSKKFLFDIKHASLRAYEFSPDGKIFASAGDKTIYFWDLNTQKISRQLDCPKYITDIAFSPDGALIAAAAANGVYVWDANSGKLINELNDLKIKEFSQKYPLTSAGRQVAFSPQGNILAAIGYDKDDHKILFVWDLPNNKLLYKITGDKDNNAGSWDLPGRAGLLFSPGGSFIVTSGLKRKGSNIEYIQFWDTLSGQLIQTLDYTVDSNLFSPYQSRYGFSPDGRLFAIADGAIVHILRIAASSDNQKEDILPTSIPVPTSPPRSTNTPAPTAAIESTFPNLSVVKTDSFDDPNDPEWRFDSSATKIENGVLQFVGKNWTGGAHYDTNLREGYGVIINFKYTQGSEFEMFFENGNWNTDPYKRFGVYIVNDQAETNIWQGVTPLGGQTFKGGLSFNPDTWYSLLLMIEKNNEFYAQIWNPENPAQTVEYKNTFGADWSDLPWAFHIGANTGTILFDDFKEMQTK